MQRKNLKDGIPEKPPLGIKPRWLHDEHRYIELHEAVSKRKGTEFEIPQEWIKEAHELAERMRPDVLNAYPPPS